MKTKYTKLILFGAGILHVMHVFISKCSNGYKRFLKDFIKCGVVGWCLEIVFTAFHTFQKRDMRLIGHTSLWMFPIYGCAIIIKPFANLLKGKPLLLRGSVYTLGIYLIEYLSGYILMRRNACPWNYHSYKWQINDVIRLDFAPFWFVTGLLYEHLLTKDK